MRGWMQRLGGLLVPSAQDDEYYVEWVGQEGGKACAIACLAMLLGTDFAEARSRVPAYDPEVGIVMGDLLRVLTENGWAYQEKWPHYSPAKRDRPRWPLRPWAPIHVCAVTSGGWHAVVMLADGTVLDPLTPIERRLDDYPVVHQMVGLWRVG